MSASRLAVWAVLAAGIMAPPAGAQQKTFTFLSARGSTAWFSLSGGQRNGDVASVDLAIFYASGAAQRQGKPIAYVVMRQDVNCSAWTATVRKADYFDEAGGLIDTETPAPGPPSAIAAGTPGDLLAKLHCRGELPSPTFQASSVAEVLLRVRSPAPKPAG